MGVAKAFVSWAFLFFWFYIFSDIMCVLNLGILYNFWGGSYEYGEDAKWPSVLPLSLALQSKVYIQCNVHLAPTRLA